MENTPTLVPTPAPVAEIALEKLISDAEKAIQSSTAQLKQSFTISLPEFHQTMAKSDADFNTSTQEFLKRYDETLRSRVESIKAEEQQSQTGELLGQTKHVLPNQPSHGQSDLSLKEDKLQEQPFKVPDQEKPLETLGSDQVLHEKVKSDGQKPTELEINLNKLFGESENALGQDIKTREYQLLLPTQFEEIRSYLENDKFLSGDEVTRALFNARLDRTELHAKVEEKLPQVPEDHRNKIVDYLWMVHEDVKDRPLEIEAGAKYRLTNFQVRPGHQEESKDIHKTQLIDDELSYLKKQGGLEIVSGGFMANFIHNLRNATHLHERIERLEKLREYQLDPTMDQNLKYKWKDIEPQARRLGLTEDKLKDSGYYTQLLKGQSTGLMTFEMDQGNGQKKTLQGTLNINNGQLYMKAAQNVLVIPETYLGYKISDEDAKKLREDKNLGKLVTLVDQTTKKSFEGYLGVDPVLNRMVVLRADNIKIQDKLLGTELSQEQKDQLREGKQVLVKGMTSKFNNEVFDGFVQINPHKRNLQIDRVTDTLVVDLKQAPAPVKEALKTEDGKQAVVAEIKNAVSQATQKVYTEQDGNTVRKLDLKNAELIGISSDQLKSIRLATPPERLNSAQTVDKNYTLSLSTVSVKEQESDKAKNLYMVRTQSPEGDFRKIYTNKKEAVQSYNQELKTQDYQKQQPEKSLQNTQTKTEIAVNGTVKREINSESLKETKQAGQSQPAAQEAKQEAKPAQNVTVQQKTTQTVTPPAQQEKPKVKKGPKLS